MDLCVGVGHKIIVFNIIGKIKLCSLFHEQINAKANNGVVVARAKLQLQTFFSVFYFTIYAGLFISTILSPQIREDVDFFGDNTCYSLGPRQP